ncbi:FecR family protein [Sphingobacterium litopenaei]|uniref:FecR family protein n=1 Tax=Sphingobacterium litopenaei TaxID=2763500 RepID=A0ABR7YDT5_9SPHI|nr:FecR family protein [Sphingobacterium litopenaei]MBD1429475.1 FecR family protein [Sphingobacterium litopenaei]
MHLNKEEAPRISFLIRKKINDNLTAFEAEELASWVSASSRNEELYQQCLDKGDQKKAFEYLEKIHVASAWKDVKEQLNNTERQIEKPKIGRLFAYIAAACLLVFGSITLITQWYQKIDNQDIANSPIDYKPANNQATIKLSNGKSYTLDNNQESVSINSTSIAYSNGQEITSTDDITSAEIHTPRGGYYKIILPDGTKAQLNAASSLSYPLTFSGNKREVSITGEVYFEVTPNKKQPFVVQSKQQEIEVLGTTFNINAYEANSGTKTTLVEGKVKVIPKTNKTLLPTILQPGQQSVITTNKVFLQEIDSKSEIAWINGKFNFDGKKLKEVMQELSRWYDIDVIIDHDVPNIEFFGGTFRNNNLSTILTLLEHNDITYTLSTDKKLFIKKLIKK